MNFLSRKDKKTTENNKGRRNLEYLTEGIGDILEDIKLMEQMGTSDIDVAKKMRDGDFEDYEIYLQAEKLGAKTFAQYQFTKEMKAPDYKTALEMKAKEE